MAGSRQCPVRVFGCAVPPFVTVLAAAALTAPAFVSMVTELSTEAAALSAQVAALQDLYNATSGPTWWQNAGWNMSSDAEPCQSWHGILCDANGIVT